MISLFNKFKVAIFGLIQAFKDKSVALQCVIAIFVLLFGFFYSFNGVEWMLILNCIFIVILMEIVNTCIERVCDLVDLNKNEKIKVIKDMSAGGVLLASIYAIVVGCMILGGVLR